jgi:hypothetical protein
VEEAAKKSKPTILATYRRTMQPSADGFEEFLAKGQKVVDSVKWGGS